MRAFIIMTLLAPHLALAQPVHEDGIQENAPAPQQEKSFSDKTMDAAKDAAKSVNTVLNETRSRRGNSNYFFLGNFSYIDLLIPGKYGASFGVISGPDKTWEVEYLRASLSVPFLIEDLGQMTDDRFSIIRRNYFGGNSFNLSYGLSYMRFSIELGDEMLQRISGGVYPAMNLIEIESLGLNVGVGNRWTFGHDITLSVDWLAVAQPIYVTKKETKFLDYATDQKDRDNVSSAVSAISYMPRISFLKFQLGMLF